MLQLLDINKRVQKQNNVPREFPNFVRNGFDIKVVADSYSAAPNGLIYKVTIWHVLLQHEASSLLNAASEFLARVQQSPYSAYSWGHSVFVD